MLLFVHLRSGICLAGPRYVTDHRAPVNPVEDRPAMLMKSFGSLNETKNAELVYGYPLGKHQFDGQLAYHQPPDPDANLSGMSKHKGKANCLMPDALDLEKGEIGDEAEKFQKIVGRFCNRLVARSLTDDLGWHC